MKSRISILVSALALLAGCCEAGAVTKEFELPAGQPSHSGYAEVVFTKRLGTAPTLRNHHDIWFDGPKKYRVESEMSSRPGRRVYEVRDGAYSYSLVPEANSTSSPRWKAHTSFLPDNGALGSSLQPDITMENARLVETTSLQGLPVQHWKSITHDTSGIVRADVWISTDRRFPMVLKSHILTARFSSNWEITKLDIDSPIPGYIFTPQTHPQPGLLAFLKMPFWPQWMTLLWYVPFLACCGVLVRSLAAKNGGRRAMLTGVAAGLGMLALLCSCAKHNIQWYEFRNLPTQIAIAGILLVFVINTVRSVGWPRNSRLSWNHSSMVLQLILAAAITGTMLGFYPLLSATSLARLSIPKVPFMPALLLNVFIYCVSWAFIEEFIFRGYLYSALSEKTQSLRKVNLLQALVFAVYHIPRDVITIGVHYSLLLNLGWMFALGLFFGALRHRYGNLSVPWIVHTVYNVAYFYVLTATDAGLFMHLRMGG